MRCASHWNSAFRATAAHIIDLPDVGGEGVSLDFMHDLHSNGPRPYWCRRQAQYV